MLIRSNKPSWLSHQTAPISSVWRSIAPSRIKYLVKRTMSRSAVRRFFFPSGERKLRPCFLFAGRPMTPRQQAPGISSHAPKNVPAFGFGQPHGPSNYLRYGYLKTERRTFPQWQKPALVLHVASHRTWESLFSNEKKQVRCDPTREGHLCFFWIR